jgi:antagonist of KipI
VARPCDIEVQRAGLLTTVQDMGRWGHQAVGVSVSGALDLVSHRAANALVGNESTAATLEITIAGPELRCRSACMVAITGADLSPQVDGQRVPLNQAVPVPAAAVLGFGTRHAGARAYIAWAGGLDVPPTLGSRCTDVPSGLGGLSGRALREGDRLWLAPRGPMPRRRVAPGRGLPPQGGVVTLRVLPGPQVDRFAAGAFEQLRGLRFVVSPASNRMGFRLTGGTVHPPHGEMLSDVTFPGGLQVPPSGEPILLMADRQTTGGYAQLAVVISADLPLAGQLAPGDAVEFEPTSRAVAMADLAAQERRLQHLEGHAFT